MPAEMGQNRMTFFDDIVVLGDGKCININDDDDNTGVGHRLSHYSITSFSKRKTYLYILHRNDACEYTCNLCVGPFNSY